MATLTPEQSQNLLRQLQEAQRQLDAYKASQGFSQAPNKQQLTGNTAIDFGASGRGEYLTPELNARIERAITAGVPMSELGSPTGNPNNPYENYTDRPDKFVRPTLSASQANSYVQSFGLTGIVDPKKYIGKDPNEVNSLLVRERAKRTGQISQMTSFAFNPETLASTKRIIDRANLSVNEINNAPWNSKGTQTDQIKSILEGSSREIASLFNSQEAFQNAMTTNPQLQKTMQTFEALGGNQADIQNKIQIPQTQSPTTVDGYLNAINNPQANQEAEKLAMDELFPERQIAQQEIMRQARIPQEMADLYFGTEEQVGILAQKKLQAQEQARIIDQQMKDEKIAVERRARFVIDKNNAELQVQQTKIEENRLAAKNYMTGMLAKLGALQTTGAAPQALQTLDTKYQNASQLLENQYKFANQEIEMGLDEAINSLVTDRDSKILNLEQDLTKDFEDIMREVMKLEQSSEKEIYRITEQYARRQRERTTKYTTDLQKEAEKYAKEFGKIAGGGVDLFSLVDTISGSLNRASSKTAITSKIATVKTDIKKNLPPAVANQITNQLNDEQLRLFLEDYLNERVTRQQSFDPLPFFEQWKVQNGITVRKGKTSSNLKSQVEVVDDLDALIDETFKPN